MKNGLILDANDVKKILASYFNVSENEIIKSQYSYTIMGVTEEDFRNATERK